MTSETPAGTPNDMPRPDRHGRACSWNHDQRGLELRFGVCSCALFERQQIWELKAQKIPP